ncbi:MAG: hypothetical protein RL456_570 [Pseudomonadota bacterium]
MSSPLSSPGQDRPPGPPAVTPEACARRPDGACETRAIAREAGEAAGGDRDAMLREMADATGTYLWEMSVPDWRVTYVDGAVEAVRGLTAAQMLRGAGYEAIVPEDRLRIDVLREQTLREGRTQVGVEFRALRPDGRLHWLSSDWAPRMDAGGRIVAVRGATRDITSRKALSSELAERTRQLDARLREMRCLLEVSVSLGDFSLSPRQAAQVVVTCLPMALETPREDGGGTRHGDGPAGVPVAVTLLDEHAGDEPPPGGWALSLPIELDDEPLGRIDLGATGLVSGPGTDLLPALGRELARWVQRRQATDLLRRSERQLRHAHRLAGLGDWWCDPVTGRIVLSDATRAMVGVAPGEVADLDGLLVRVMSRDRPRLRRQWEAAMLSGSLDIEFRLAHPLTSRWLHLIAEMVTDEGGRVVEINGTMRDISARKHDEERMRLSARIFDAAGESMVVTNPRCEIVAVNAAFSRISGYAPEEVLGRNPRLLKSGRQHPAFYERMWKSLRETDSFQSEFLNRAKDGRIYPLMQTLSVLRDTEGRITHYVGIGADLSRLRQAEARSHHLSRHDPLTDLPNRHEVITRVDQLAGGSPAALGAALMVVGLDGFKTINDSLGHGAGDAVLIEMAARLRHHERLGHFVGRLGGDEFVLLIAPVGRDGCVEVARALLERLSAPLTIHGHELTVTVSIGISLMPADGTSGEVLLRNAESALHGAKGDGRNTFRFYDPRMNQASLDRLILVSSLRRAIPAGELHAWYQPKLDLHTRELVGAEALVRWRHPEQGWIQPGRFIPVAEQSDLIVAIGEWMLEAVAAQMARWQAQGRGWLPVAVNLGARHFGDPHLPERLARLRERHGLPEGVLELEITESTLMEVGAEPQRLLGDLRRAGMRLSIDDFGTGYSSLSYLKMLPVDALKIDRSFVHGIESDPRDLNISSTIVAMAHGFGLRVIAEGVETEGQRALLERLGCDEGQGWLFARPMPAAEFEAWWQVWAPQPA